MHKKINIVLRNIALVAITGNMLYWIFPFPPIVWRVLIVLLCMSVCFFYKKFDTTFEKILLLFVGFNLIHFLISYLWLHPSTTQIGNILFGMMPLYLFVFLTKKGVITDKFMTMSAAIFLVAAIMQYYHSRSLFITRNDLGADRDITNNASTVFLMLLPFFFSVKNNIQKWISLAISVFFIVMSAKRGNILAAVIPISLYVHCFFKGNKQSFLKTLLVMALFIGSSIILYKWVEANDYLLRRFEQTIEGDSSHRDVLYSNAWYIWLNSNNIVNYLFGLGFDATIHSSEMSLRAHSDWLEILVDYGLLGVSIYLLMFLSLFYLIKETKNTNLKIICLSAFFIWLFKSIYSMAFSTNSMCFLMMVIGIIIGTEQQNNNITVPDKYDNCKT